MTEPAIGPLGKESSASPGGPVALRRRCSAEKSSELRISFDENPGFSEDQRRTALVELNGVVDMATSAQVRQVVHTLVESGRRQVLVDTARVDFIDASGVATLVGAAHEAVDAGGWLRLRAPSAKMCRLLGLLHLESVFLIE